MKPIKNIIKNTSGYLWMAASLAVAVALFSSIGTWQKRLIDASGIKVSPKYTGGEVIATIDHKTYHTDVHRPVFDGPFGIEKKGFIQIDWMENGGTAAGSIPALIEESFDYDKDGRTDFTVTLDTVANKARLNAHNPDVLAVLDRSTLAELTMKGYPDARYGVFTHKDGRSIRVLLKKDE